MPKINSKQKWYAAGLHFECSACGSCCCGPDEGYVWATKKEVELMADFLKISTDRLRKDYTRRIGLRTSLIEKPENKDCIFIKLVKGRKQCVIYPVRPSQCRNWPFWPANLKSLNDWNAATAKCPGINRGKLYTPDEIENINNRKKWWPDEP